MKDKFNIKIKPRHFKNASVFTDNYGCPLYQALKEKYPIGEFNVGSDSVTINNTEYIILDGWFEYVNKNQLSKKSKITFDELKSKCDGEVTVDKLIDLAKSGDKLVGTYKIKLIKE